GILAYARKWRRSCSGDGCDADEGRFIWSPRNPFDESAAPPDCCQRGVGNALHYLVNCERASQRFGGFAQRQFLPCTHRLFFDSPPKRGREPALSKRKHHNRIQRREGREYHRCVPEQAEVLQRPNPIVSRRSFGGEVRRKVG